jgi:hypothetical protein
MQAILVRKALWAIVCGRYARFAENTTDEAVKLKWTETAKKAYATLMLGMSSQVQMAIADLENSHEIWQKLEALYASKGHAAKHMLLKELTRVNLDSHMSVESYVESIKRTSKRLSQMGAKVPDWELIGYLIFGLNDSYNTLITVLENSKQETELTFESVAKAIHEESHHHVLNDDATVLLTKWNKGGKDKKKSKDKNKDKSKNDKNCSHCGKEGHVNSDC